jgi:putative drug exporter of the RND superfamily
MPISAVTVRISDMFNFLGRLAVTHPWKIVLGWVTAAVLLLTLTPTWETKAHDEDIRFLPERCASVRGYHLMAQAFPRELDCSRITFALERSTAPLTPKDFALVDQLVGDLEQLHQADSDLKIGKIYSYRDPMIGKRLTSSDGLCTLIQVSLATPYLALQTQLTVDRTEAALRKRLDSIESPPELLTTGAAGIGRDLIHAGGNSLDRTTLATVALVIFILLLVYRAPLLALVPLVTIALSVCVALRLLALMTQIPGVHLVNVSQIFAVVLLYGAGTDYCLFLISRYREELEDGKDAADAIANGVGAVGAALAASAGTVICGLSLMGFAEFAKVRSAGPAIAIALLVALAGSLTLTPALLRLLGRGVFWPFGRLDRNAAAEQSFRGPLGWLNWFRSSFWEWVSHKVVARPLLIWSLSVMLLLPLAILGIQTTAICRPTGELSPQSASIRGMDAIQRHFTAGETGPLTLMLSATIDWSTQEGKQLIAFVGDGLCRLPNVAEVRSLPQPLGRLMTLPSKAEPAPSGGNLLGGLLKNLRRDVVTQAIAQASQTARDFYVTTIKGEGGPRYVTRLDVVLKTDPFDVASTATLEEIEGWLARELPRSTIPMGWVEAECYGVTVYSRDMASVTHSDRLRVNVLVMAGIFLILVALIHHIGVAAYLLATVLLSYFTTLGATALVGAYFSGYPIGQMDWRVPFFLFTILAAVGEDYNILLVSRILQERKKHGDQEGIRLGLSRTGGTITACGIIMAGTFATLTLGGLNTLIQIGFALAFGVLLDTFIVRPFLVPAFLLLFWKERARLNVVQTPAVPTPYRKSA